MASEADWDRFRNYAANQVMARAAAWREQSYDYEKAARAASRADAPEAAELAGNCITAQNVARVLKEQAHELRKLAMPQQTERTSGREENPKK